MYHSYARYVDSHQNGWKPSRNQKWEPEMGTRNGNQKWTSFLPIHMRPIAIKKPMAAMAGKSLQLGQPLGCKKYSHSWAVPIPIQPSLEKNILGVRGIQKYLISP